MFLVVSFYVSLCLFSIILLQLFYSSLDFIWDCPGEPVLEQEIVSGSGISWAICKSAPRPRQTTMPTSHRSFFTGWMLFLPPTQQHQSTVLYNILNVICCLCFHNCSSPVNGHPSQYEPSSTLRNLIDASNWHHQSYDVFWRLRVKIIRTVLCCVICDRWAQW